MKIFKNTEAAKLVSVSHVTIGKWIEQALEGGNTLQLIETKNGQRIIDNEHNRAELERLAEHGKNYRATTELSRVVPSDYFYNTYTKAEIVEIINSLETFSEIPHKFVYKGDGAKFWDWYYTHTVPEGKYSNPTKVSRLLGSSIAQINFLTEKQQSLNIVEIGPGNALPTKDFIAELIKQNRIKRYIAVDISQEMVEITKKNIQEWFPSLPFVGLVGDVETFDLQTLLFEYSDTFTSNVILYLGSTIGIHQNRQKVLANVSSGLGYSDLFIFSNTLDGPKTRTTSDYAKSPDAVPQNTRISKNLGIETEQCNFKMYFDAESCGKFLALELNKDYQITFQVGERQKQLHLLKNSEVIVWRLHMTRLDTLNAELTETGMQQLSLLTDRDKTHCLVISGKLK